MRRAAGGLALVAGLLGFALPDPTSAQEASAPRAEQSHAATGFALGPPAGGPLLGAALDARTQELASLLRCPVCQGLSVADSPATMAQNMKGEVREMLAAGYDQDQILGHFEQSYGEFVRLKPPLRGVNWLVWLGPVAGLLAGVGVVAWALKRLPGTGGATALGEGASAPGELGASELPSRDTLPADPRLASAVLRVRELAYGWTGGVAPGKTRPAE